MCVFWRITMPRRESSSGFALVTSLMLVSLILLIALGLASLASIELRRTTLDSDAAQARVNARLALMMAIGQLQRTLGPDQRVSASADILGNHPAEPHWTGVWRTTQPDGSPLFSRDDLQGGLRDTRFNGNFNAADTVMEWLVSGEGDPRMGADEAHSIRLHGDSDSKTAVRVPLRVVKRSDGSVSGRQAWWTGDLAVRANLQTTDPRADLPLSRGAPGSPAWYRVMASQAADMTMMKGDVAIPHAEARRLASAPSISLTAAGKSWADQHALDFTVDSRGVIADVARGGLRQDLTAFFDSSGEVPSWKNLPGLREDDPLVAAETGGEATSRLREAGPKFGLLRDWARMNLAFRGGKTATKLPDMLELRGSRNVSAVMSLANETPVMLAGNRSASIQPVLVEATLFTQISTFGLPGYSPPRYQLRHHHYPRVVLWNPYNVDLEFERSMIMIQGNGRQEMWTENESINSRGEIIRFNGQWLSFEGGRSADFFVRPGESIRNIMKTAGYNDSYMGSYYFAIPKTRFAPGECLVFSPARSAEYDCFSAYRQGSYDLNANELSCEVAPDPARSYYISGTDIGGGIPYKPVSFWFAPTPYWSVNGRFGVENQGDDTRAILKHIGDRRTISFEDFDRAPQLAVLSASLQYGAGREPRIAWNQLERMPLELLNHSNPRPTVIPNVRTREGIRLRWFDEHPSNQINSGALAGTPHFEEALLANWNPRASFIVRSPWENIAGTLPQSGTAGGPWFFGAYTRDLYDQAVGWDEQVPVVSEGRCYGNPFGPPQEGTGRYVLFDVPRAETGVISLAQLQHVKISELVWHPSYAIGNSLADPRLALSGETAPPRSAALARNPDAAKMGGFHQDQIGWSSDTERSSTRDEWAATARAILGDVPKSDNLVYDLSFEANHTLWDRYYLSTGSAADKSRFLEDPDSHPLPNGRMRPVPASSASADSLTDFHQSAYHLMIDGAFNVNSTRVEAWKALLASTRATGLTDNGNVPFPRVLDPPDAPWKTDDPADSDAVWSGSRELTPEEIHLLATAITREVRLRGPFLSLADFVNRRLANDETGRMGALEAAIEKSGINARLKDALPLDNSISLPDYRHPDNISDATRMEQTLKPSSKAWGAPAWLTQADVLQVIGPALSARSDTFVIRAYGDALDASGKITARAWCEAVVQRHPQPIEPDASGINPANPGKPGDFGRRFHITSFRWLTEEDV
jgi:type II secretory pathway pseudopilin PulG